MARNRQRARDRKQQHRDVEPGAVDDASLEAVADAADDGPVALGDADGAAGGAPTGAAARAERSGGGPRLVHFLRACWAELQRVEWPDRRQVGQATAVVLGFVVVAGAFLGLADVVAQEIVDLII